MNRIEQGVLVVCFLGLFVPAFMWFSKQDLPMQVRGLDRWKAPKDPAGDKANSLEAKEPIAALVAAGKRAIEPVVAVLADGQRPIDARKGAAMVLGRIGDASASAALVAAAAEPRLVAYVGDALRRIGTGAFPAIAPVFQDAAQAKLAIALAPYVAQLEPSSQAVGLLRKAVDVKHCQVAEVRAASVLALNAIESTVAVKAQALAILDPDEAVRRAARAALGKRNPETAIRVATQLLASDERERKLLGVAIASEVKHNDAGGTLQEAFGEKDVAVAIAAAPGYARYLKLFPKARDAFVKRLKQLLSQAKTDDQLIALGRAAGASKITDLLDFYEKWLASGTPGQQVAAVAALGYLGDHYTPGKLIPLIEGKDKRLAKAATDALGTLFGRARHDWPRWHYGGQNVPSTPADWKGWWVEQKWVHDKAAEVKKAQKVAEALISKGTYKSMDQAESMCRRAISALEDLTAKTQISHEGQIRQLQSLIQISIKMRPVK